MKRVLLLVLLLAFSAFGQGRRRSVRVDDPVPVFTFDAGFRVLNATNPAPGVDPLTGEVYLYYVDQTAKGERLRISADGLTFGPAMTPSNWKNDSRNTLMPDGRTWRRYQYDPRTTNMASSVSTDGSNFTPESGIRYAPQPDDHGVIGVYDFFSDRAGGVVLLYLGDLYGRNNVRRAYSRDGGLTFTFERGNVLGDDAGGGGPNSYVDEKTTRLPDGRIRLFAMRMHVIHSFISADDGMTFALEQGPRLQVEDFREAQLTSLNDPVVVRLPDGRYRMYVASLRADNVWTIVSATTMK